MTATAPIRVTGARDRTRRIGRLIRSPTRRAGIGCGVTSSQTDIEQSSSDRSLFGPALAVAIFSGAVIALQGKINGDLSSAGTEAIVATWLSYFGTAGAAVVVLAALGQLPSALRAIRSKGHWWWFAIGLCGIPLVIAMSMGIPIIGVALASVCSVAGQTVSGLVLDARGVGLSDPIRLTTRRIVAGLCAVAGLAIAVVTGPAPSSGSVAAAIGMGLFLFVGGFILSGQQAGNGKVMTATGNPLTATMTSATGGLIGVSILTAVVWACGGLENVSFPGADRWWLYLGGPLGTVITAAAAYAVRHLGTFAMTLAVVGGQLVMAVVLDVFGGVGAGWSTAVAIAAIAASVALAVVPKRKGAAAKA